MIKEEIVPITEDDKKILTQNLYIVIVVGGVILLVYFGVFVFWADAFHTFGMITFSLFSVFFLGILLFIVGATLVDFFETKKIILTGKITDKEEITTSSPSTRASSGSTSTNYYITIEDRKISVMLGIYNQVATGQLVELHQAKRTKSVFRTKVLQDAVVDTTPQQSSFSDSFSKYDSVYLNRLEETFDSYMNDEEKGILKSKFNAALLWRGLGGLVLCYIIYNIFYFVIGLFFIIFEIQNFKILSLAVDYLPLLLAGLILVRLNKHTYLLYQDLQEGKKTVSKEKILDVIRSNVSHLGKNVTVSQGYNSSQYAYISTTNNWVGIPVEKIEEYKAKGAATIHKGFYSKVVVRVEAG